ncbi:MAG: RNA polymerase sigma factor [Solirubrobacteraceae bacterium]
MSTCDEPSSGGGVVELEWLWGAWTQERERVCRNVGRRAGRPFDDPAVQDAASDALLRLHRHLVRGRAMPPVVGSWLVVVAWREFLRQARRDARRREFEAEAFVRGERVDVDRRPESIVARREQRRARCHALGLALGTLPAGQRETLQLFAEGASYTQIADWRNTSWRSVDRALVKARARLRNNGLLVREVRAWDA